MGISLSKKQRMWLNQYGGRTLSDVYVKKGILGIYLHRDGFKLQFKPIPPDSYLEIKVRRRNKYHSQEIVVDKYER